MNTETPHVKPLKNRGRAYLSCLLFVYSCLINTPVARALSVIDDSGQTLSLERPAERIVSLSPHTTELLFAAGAGEAVVGVAEFSDYPAHARTLPRIGSAANLNLEAIVGLRPDLVVAWKSGNTGGQVEQLQRLGLPVFFSEPRKLPDIVSSLERLGDLAGSRPYAEKAAAQFARELEVLSQTHASSIPVSVFYEIWPQPLMTVNGEHLIDQVITLCGGVNIFSELPGLAPVVDIEAVLAANPAVIINASSSAPGPGWSDKWRRWPQLDAVRFQQLYAMDPDTIHRQTPRILEGARQLCGHLERARKSLPAVAPP